MEGGGEVSEQTKPDKAVIWEIERLNNLNSALRAHAERLAEALTMIIEIETGTSMAVIGWTDAMDKAIKALTLYRAENPKV